MESLGLHVPTLIIYLVNFAILLVLLYLVAYKPILRMIDQRSERIKESLEAADRAREEAAASQADTQQQLNEARLQGQRLLDQARTAAEQFRVQEEARARQTPMLSSPGPGRRFSGNGTPQWPRSEAISRTWP